MTTLHEENGSSGRQKSETLTLGKKKSCNTLISKEPLRIYHNIVFFVALTAEDLKVQWLKFEKGSPVF